MASGTIYGGFSGGTNSDRFTYKAAWRSTPDQATNTSQLVIEWYLSINSAGWYTNKQNAPWSEIVNGVSDSGTMDFNYPSPQTLTPNYNYLIHTTTKTITHENDGSKSLGISGTFDLGGTSAGIGSLADTITLDRIHRTPPTVSAITATDVSSPNVGAWVATKSIVQLSVTASGNDGASIASYAWYRNGVQVTGSTATYTASSAETAVGAVTYKVVVTDSYGNSTEQSITITFLAYSLPTLTTETFRCDSGGTADDTGSYVSAKATWTVASVGSNAGTCSVSVNGQTVSLTNGTASIINAGLSASVNYDASYTLTDSFGSTATKTDTILSEFTDFSLHPSGGAAFGETAEQGKLKSAYDVKIESGHTITIGQTSLTESQLQQLLALI